MWHGRETGHNYGRETVPQQVGGMPARNQRSEDSHRDDSIGPKLCGFSPPFLRRTHGRSPKYAIATVWRSAVIPYLARTIGLSGIIVMTATFCSK